MIDSCGSPDDSNELLVSEAVDEFVREIDLGEQPDVDDYVQRYPRVAHVLRSLLPALQAMQASDTPCDSGQRVEDVMSLSGRLGDFRIVREIGRGGMGIVYEAEQISLRRRVALKVLPFAATLDPRRLDRFQNEAQAAARLHHGNIVPIYAVGSERGICYYAMQMIDGLCLAEVVGRLAQRTSQASARATPASRSPTPGSHVLEECFSTHPQAVTSDGDGATALADTLPGVAAAALSTITDGNGEQYFRTVARLGEQAAAALQHAHDLDVIHRDVKPANILIDIRGNLWVTDFGLARLHNDKELTVSGDVLGTFRYMSPEQALGRRGVVDHRTDIYSLGATLYELLAYQPAFDGEDRVELRQQVASRDPIPPRRLNRAVPNDLETIVLKALEKDPKDRYATAGEMSEDFRRFLDNCPIQAKRPSLVERARKWSRRHRALVTASVVVLLLAVIGLTISNVLITRERSKTRTAYQQLAIKQRATESALAREEQQRALADANLRQARDVLDFVVQASIDDLAANGSAEDLRSRLLQATLVYYQGFIEQSHDDRLLQTELASDHARVAKILDVIGSSPEARSALEQALETQERLVRERPYDMRLRHGLFTMYYQLRVMKGGFALALLEREPIQQHLDLQPHQIAGIHRIHEEHERILREFSRSSSPNLATMREEFRSRMDGFQAELAELLTEDQLARLEQIALQRKGFWGLDDPEVASRIGLTATQRSLIWETLQEAWKRRWTGPWRPSVSLDDQIRDILTPEQHAAWEEMLGDRFEPEPPRPPRRFPVPMPRRGPHPGSFGPSTERPR